MEQGELCRPRRPVSSRETPETRRAGRRGDALKRRRLRESFLANEKEALAAFRHRRGSTRYRQDMAELLAKLGGELTKDAAEGVRGVQVIILNNQGEHPLDPEVFREAAERRVMEEQRREGIALRRSIVAGDPGSGS